MAKSEYEVTREANIAKNRALLESLGLSKPLIEPKEIPFKKTASKKRKQPEQPDDLDAPPTKLKRAQPDQVNVSDASLAEISSVRRSSRNVGKEIDYTKEVVKSLPRAAASSLNEGAMGREDGKRVHNPRVHGSIPGIAVGTWWQMRKGCSVDAIHPPLVGGIYGNKNHGAYSVCLSGGYEDDVDEGYAFTYTGSGGRDLRGTKNQPKNLRTAPQSSDQDPEHNFNRMLKRSYENKKPVRVIRGFKGKSKYAPTEGYRYDGLYSVEKAWVERGNNKGGFLVCKYAFKRLPNQPPIPVRALEDGELENNLGETKNESGEVDANEAEDNDEEGDASDGASEEA